MPGKDRQRALARAKLERQMARRAESARRRRQIQAAIGALLATALVIGGTWFLVNQFGPKDTDTAATPEPSLCTYNDAEKAAKDVGRPPTEDIKTEGTVTSTITLNSGAVEVELDAAKAPCTTNSFTHLASKKYFDGTTCHRLVTSGILVLQCGDPTGSGSGGPGYQFAEENLPAAGEKNYPKGVLAMARTSQPGTNGSQFFIVYGDTSLPADYTIFGKVTKGLDVVEKIAEVGIEGGKKGDGKPKNPVKIEKVTVA